MSTFNQLIKGSRKKKFKKCMVKALEGCPHKVGVCMKILLLKPKKPNSAIRKIARIRLRNGKRLRAGISGVGHTLQEHSVVFVRGGRVKDVPGVRYKMVIGKLDYQNGERIIRGKRRSKFGLMKLS